MILNFNLNILDLGSNYILHKMLYKTQQKAKFCWPNSVETSPPAFPSSPSNTHYVMPFRSGIKKHKIILFSLKHFFLLQDAVPRSQANSPNKREFLRCG